MRNEDLNREIAESLVLYIKNLNDESNNGSLVVVEGKRDVNALRSLGFTGKILMLCHNNNFDRLVSEAEKYRKIILLLDLDRKGRSLTKKSAILLEGKKHKIDLFFRRNLSSITCGRVKQIEELSKYAEYIVA
jgi:5S rRNA maturation endonuclease (ribonuclease M5)